MIQKPLEQNQATVVSEEVLQEFQGMNSRQSSEYQLTQWVAGRSIHNPVRDECCPDFSCCNPKGLMDKDLRIKFADAHKRGDSKTESEILGMALSGITSSMGIDVHIAGENITIN